MSRMLQNYQFLVGNDPNRRYPRGVETLDDLVTSIVNEVVGNAGIDLDSIQELADAIGNDPQFLLTLQNNDAAVAGALGVPSGQSDMGTFADPELPDASDLKIVLEAVGAAAGRLRDGLGVAAGDSDLGTFTGSTIPDSSSVKAALQALETTLEAIDLDTDDMAALVGLAENVTDLGTFTGTTISDNLTVKAALQEIETAIENAGVGDVATEAAARIAADTAIQNDVDQNEADADAADAALSGRLDTLEADPTTKTYVDNQVATLSSADVTLQANIDAVQADVDANEATVFGLLTQLETSSDAADALLQTNINNVQADVNQNELDADNAIAAVAADLVTEENARLSGDASEASARQAADNTLQANIDAVQSDVDANETNAAAARLALDNRIATLEVDPVTKTYVDTEVAGLVNAAPATLDTLNELAAALDDDPNFATTITTQIGDETTARTNADNALDTRVTALEADPTTQVALQAEIDRATAAENANEVHIDNLVVLSGVAKDAQDLGTFTGTLIPDASDVKQALQALETEVETFDVGAGITDILDGTSNFTALKLRNTTVLADGAELNILNGATLNVNELNTLDGITATTAELNTLDGITADVNELNTLDGITASTAELNTLTGVTADVNELNLLDGVTSTTAELNILDGVTATTAEINLLDGVTSTTAELNILDGVTASSAEINHLSGVTSGLQAQIDAKAPLASPALTGTPTAPTAVAGTNTTQLATTAYVSTAVANVIDAAPGALDTLNELAAALGDDANFSTTITNSIAAVQSDVDQNELDADNALAAIVDGTTNFTGFQLAATSVTATGAELNVLDGITATTAELNILDGVTATAAELNILDGVTSTAAELNLLDGATATTAEINHLSGVTSAIQTQLNAIQSDVDQNESDADAAIAANEVHIDNAATLSGVLKDSTDLGVFTGTTIADNVTIKAALQALETEVETKGDANNTALTGVPTAPTAAADTNTTQIATTAYVQTEISDLIDGAPDGLNTLNELAQAINDDTNALGNATTLINANTSDIADIRTTQGTADGDTNLGTFTGSTIADNETVKGALQDLEDQVEANHAAAALRTALGITENAGDPADGRGMYFDTVASKYLLSS